MIKKNLKVLTVIAAICLMLSGCSDLFLTESASTLNNATELTINADFTNGNLIKGSQVWYYFNAQKDTLYKLYVDDKVTRGSGSSYTGYTKQTLYRPDGTTAIGTSGSFPRTFTAPVTDKIYIKVTGFSTDSEGTFGIKIEK